MMNLFSLNVFIEIRGQVGVFSLYLRTIPQSSTKQQP
jgi:hypothetical protein